MLKAQKEFQRTPSGRLITEYAVQVIDASLEDTKNYGAEVVKCKNCCIILSSLLVPEGCANCGSKDLTSEINEDDII
jgi:hypothetical protein